EVALVVPSERVAGDVPAVLDVPPLAIDVAKVATARGTAHGQPADFATFHFGAAGINAPRFVARNHAAGRSGSNVVSARRDEDVQHLRGADAVDDTNARSLLPRLERRSRQMLAGRYALSKRRNVVRSEHAEHRAVCCRRRPADGGAMLLDALDELWRSGLLQQQRRCTNAHWEQDQPTEAERERKRWRPAAD